MRNNHINLPLRTTNRLAVHWAVPIAPTLSAQYMYIEATCLLCESLALCLCLHRLGVEYTEILSCYFSQLPFNYNVQVRGVPPTSKGQRVYTKYSTNTTCKAVLKDGVSTQYFDEIVEKGVY